jgi:hypothetical protein
LARKREVTNVYKILVGKSEEKRLLGRPGRRWKYIIKTDLKKIGCGRDSTGSG